MAIQSALVCSPIITLCIATSYLSDQKSAKYPDSSAVWSAIKANEIGVDFAKLANNTPNPKIERLHCTEIPFHIFTIDFGNGIECSVMAENDHLVLLCSGFGGGRATGFSVLKEGKESILTFNFSTGSGIIRTVDCKYVLGSRVVSSKERPWQP